MTHYAQAIWKCRYFWSSLVKNDLRARYKRSTLGIAWSLLQPIAMSIVICVVFHQLFEMDIATFGIHVLSGMAFWAFITASVTGGCISLYQGEMYIRQHRLPMAVYPLRSVLGAAFHFGLSLVIVFMVAGLSTGWPAGGLLLTLIPTLLLLFLFGWAIAILMSFANVYFPDTQHLAEVGLQILFYATPIIYEAKRLKLEWLEMINPMAAFLSLLRAPLLYGQPPELLPVLLACGATLVAMGLAMLVLWRLERTVIFHL